MILRLAVWPAFFFPNLTRTRFDRVAVSADWVGLRARNAKPGNLAAAAGLVAKSVAIFDLDRRGDVRGVPSASDRITAVLRREEKHRTLQA